MSKIKIFFDQEKFPTEANGFLIIRTPDEFKKIVPSIIEHVEEISMGTEFALDCRAGLDTLKWLIDYLLLTPIESYSLLLTCHSDSHLYAEEICNYAQDSRFPFAGYRWKSIRIDPIYSFVNQSHPDVHLQYFPPRWAVREALRSAERACGDWRIDHIFNNPTAEDWYSDILRSAEQLDIETRTDEEEDHA